MLLPNFMVGETEAQMSRLALSQSHDRNSSAGTGSLAVPFWVPCAPAVLGWTGSVGAKGVRAVPLDCLLPGGAESTEL